MGRTKLPKKKNQGDTSASGCDDSGTRKNEAPALKDVKATKVRTHALRLVNSCWCWLKKHFSEFIVTMCGVWAAFYLAGWGEQKALDKATQQRLHLVVLEARYNCDTAKKICRDYVEAVDPNIIRVRAERPNTTAATAAFQDANVLSFVPLHKISFLRGYLHDIETLNQILQIHQGVLESQGYKASQQEKNVRQKVHENAATVFATAHVLQEELAKYFHEKSYDLEEIKGIRDRVNCIKEEVLKGEFPPSKED